MSLRAANNARQSRGFPFGRHLQAGVGVLGWPPAVFWQATPRELRVALDGYMGHNGQTVRPPLSVSRLGELMSAYPDA